MGNDWSRRALLAALAGSFAGCSVALPSRDRTGETDTPAETVRSVTPTETTRSPTSQSRSPPDGFERLPAEEPGLAWAIQLPGHVNTLPAVSTSRGHVYVGTGIRSSLYPDAPDSDSVTGVYALETANGAFAWRETTKAPVTQRPVVHDGRVHVVTGNANGYHGVDQRIIAYDQTGTARWATRPRNQSVSVVATTGGTLFAGTKNDEYGVEGQSLFAVGPDGEVRWEREAGDAMGGTLADGLVLYNAAFSALAAYDPTDGTKVWQIDNEPIGGPPSNTTAFDGLCFTKHEPNTSGNNALVAHSTADGTEQWRYTDTSTNLANFLPNRVSKVPDTADTGQTDADLVGAEFGAGVFALREEDGSEQWTFTVDGDHAIHAVVGDAVYVSDEGTIYALSPSDGREQWRRSFPDGAALWPLSDGVFGYDSRTVASFASDGTERWSFSSSKDLTWPVLAGGRAYTCASDGTVYAFETDGT